MKDISLNTNMETQSNNNQIKFEELEQFVHEKFLVKDAGIVRLICATIIANKIKSDPVWVFLVAPPSGLKTELIRALDDIKDIHPLSSLTPHTLISGQKKAGVETSLLLKIRNGIFTFKDFTSVLEMNKIARDEILSQLREIYDGQYSKSFGTGDNVKWEGKMGFLAGVTEAVDLFQGMYNILGERFVQYRMTQPDRKEATRRGMQNAPYINDIRKQVRDLFTGYITDFEIPEKLPELSEAWENEIIDLSNFATLARGAVMRDVNSRDITHIFSPEMPIRFSKQLTLIAQTFLLMGFKETDKNIIRKIAFSSLSKNRLRVFGYLSKNRAGIELAEADVINNDEEDDFGLSELVKDESEWTSRSMGVALGLPTGTARRLLQDINALGFIDRGKAGSEDTWVLKDEYKDFFSKYYMDEFFTFDIFPEKNTGIPPAT